MFLGKSITFDDGEIAGAALADSFAVQAAGPSFVDRLKAGDADAFDVMVSRYAADIYALLFRMTEDAEEAQDLTQETFMSAVKNIDKFRGDAELKTWLFRIAINHSRNRFRWWKRRRRESTFSIDEPLNESGSTGADLLPDRGEGPENAAIRSERERAIRRELMKLPDAFREAVVLCDIEGHSYEDVSEILGIGIGTVKSRIARGRGLLRKRLCDF